MRLASLCMVLIMAGSGFAGSASYLCRMTGEVQSSCCCQGGEEREGGQEEVARDQVCCQVLAAEAAAAPVVLEVSPRSLELPPAGELEVPEVGPLAERRQAAPPQARAPPPAGEALFIWKSSYLI